MDRKEDGNSVVRVRAQVMMRDDSTGGWVPMGGGGLSNVSVRKRKIQHHDDQPCKHEYLIHGKRLSDQSVVLSCTIKKDFEYNKVMPTFHHWKTGNKKFGLTFQTAADARAFSKGVRLAIEDLLEGLSETSPLHQYNLDVGDDDVFMQLHLPLEKSGNNNNSAGGESRTPTSARSPLTSLGGGGGGYSPVQPPVVSSVVSPTWSEHLIRERKLLDKTLDYSYVKFPRRMAPHEYSYPKLVDAYTPPLPTTMTMPSDGSQYSSSSKRDSIVSLKKSHLSERHLIKSSPSPIIIPPPPPPPPTSSSSCSSSMRLSSSSPSSLSKKKKRMLLDDRATCAHCRESFSFESNPRGSCQEAPDCLRRTIESVTCLQCAKCLLYHCMSDSEGDYVHPCECSNIDGHWARRWIGLTLLSILVPCLCCYVPLIACYKCGRRCNICGGKHAVV